MTKDYHLTPEQAKKLFVGVGGLVNTEGCILAVSATDLANFANAALDKVLGEPVASVYESCDYDGSLGFSIPNGRLDIAAIKGMSDSGLTAGTKLYAPKEPQ